MTVGTANPTSWAGAEKEFSARQSMDHRKCDTALDKRVLVVDDDPSTVRLLERYLTLGGYEVLTASNGADGLQVMLSEAPSMVITDWVMPEMDGVALCRAIRAHEGIGFVYLLVMTADGDKQGRVVEALDAGADDFLTKPVNREELLARLRAGERVVTLEADLAHRNLQVFKCNAQMAIVNEKLERVATTDALTGMVNRRAGMERLCEVWSLSNRYNDPLACMVLDIDHFKRFNDIHGHAVGDRVLKEVADALLAASRLGETVCRIGGEEFLVVCPKSTGRTAGTGAERLRRAVETLAVAVDGCELSVTVSLGVAERTDSMTEPDDLLKAADQALYRAKRAGRNQVVVARAEQVSAGGPTDGIQSPALGKGGAPAKETPPQALKVLVADHDAHARATCREILEREAYQVVEAADGFDVLAGVTQHTPDIIVINAVLPNLSGVGCTRQIKDDPATSDIPIIMIGPMTQETDINAGREAGADEYITKLHDARELVVRVRSMARLRSCMVDLVRVTELQGERARTMALLLDLAQDLSSSKTLDVLLERIISMAAELTCSRRISIMLPDRHGQYLTIAKAIGIDDRIAAQVRVPKGGGTSGRVFASGEPVIINTPEDGRRQAKEHDSAFFASVPLISNAMRAADRVVGVLNITERQGGQPFGPTELEYIDLISSIAAAAIDEIAARQARDDARDSIVVALARLAEYRDGGTGRHLDRVTRFSVLLADELGAAGPFCDQIDGSFVSDLQRAVPLHDIGKVGVPDRILLKPGKLTPEEMTAMQTHISIGAEIIQSVTERVPGVSFLAMAAEIICGHHEWYDGSGYPRGLQETDIPLSARITTVADVYDALTTKRPYKERFTHDHAAAIIRHESRTHFDPAVVEAFVKREGEFEALAAELADGELHQRTSVIEATNPPVLAALGSTAISDPAYTTG